MLTVLTNIRLNKLLWQIEDDLWWKMTFSGRRPSVEDDLPWKTTIGRRQLLVEDNPIEIWTWKDSQYPQTQLYLDFI